MKKYLLAILIATILTIAGTAIAQTGSIGGIRSPQQTGQNYYKGDGTVGGNILLDVGEKVILDADADDNNYMYAPDETKIYFFVENSSVLRLAGLEIDMIVALDMNGKHVYSSTSLIELGADMSSSHSLATGDVGVPNDFEVNGTAYFDGAAQIVTPVMSLTEIRFCGNGPNATTTTYIGPQVEADMDTDMTYGGAGCDAKDNTTEATADLVWSVPFAFKPVKMRCASDCGANDTMTLQLRDDEASVTGMTCNITLTGSVATCEVTDTTPATVAAGSAIAVSSVNSTDDDCSAGDLECRLWVTY